MEGIRRIIVPVDFNKHTDTLADFAIYIANKLNGRITFVHVIMRLPDSMDFDPNTWAQIEKNLLAQSEKQMTDFLATVKGKCLECDGAVIKGDVTDAILAYAADAKADLIIISTHGSKGIEKILLGSVAERVIKAAPCPTRVFNPFKGDRGSEVCSPLTECVTTV